MLSLLGVCLYMKHAGARGKTVVVQCVLVGLQIDRCVVNASGIEAAYIYLQPLTVQQSEALPQYLVDRQIYSQPLMKALLQLPLMRTQLALAAGLPQLLEFLKTVLEEDRLVKISLSYCLPFSMNGALMQR
jgi:hypothetical protein